MYNKHSDDVVILCNIIQPFHGHHWRQIIAMTANGSNRDSNGDSNGNDLYEIVSLAF